MDKMQSIELGLVGMSRTFMWTLVNHDLMCYVLIIQFFVLFLSKEKYRVFTLFHKLDSEHFRTYAVGSVRLLRYIWV